MVDIVLRPEREPGPPLKHHTGETERYDPAVAQDHTDLRMSARPRKGYKSGDPLTDATVLMRNPAFLQCPVCSGLEFRILADDSADASSGLVQFVCARPRCNLWPILELHQPQVNDILARRLGLIVPDAGMLKIQTTLDDDDDL